jgi:hypothetical protein
MSSDQQQRYLPLKQVAQSMMEFEKKSPTPKPSGRHDPSRGLPYS